VRDFPIDWTVLMENIMGECFMCLVFDCLNE
jgi:hypothetical protein